MAFSLGVVLAVRLLEAVAVNASRSTALAMGREASGLSRSTALAMAAERADVRTSQRPCNCLHLSTSMC
jgi:hypothetical protein